MVREYVFYIGTTEIFKDKDLKKTVLWFLKINLIFRRMKIEKPYKFLYQLVCLAMEQKALAKKNREVLAPSVQLYWRQLNGEDGVEEEVIIEEGEPEPDGELTAEEQEILNALENNMEL